MVPLVPGPGGILVPEDLSVVTPINISIGNQAAKVLSAEYAYGMVGVYEVQFEIPTGAATGNNVPLTISQSSGGAYSHDAVWA